MSGLLLGPGSITEAQLVAFSAAGAVMLLLLSLNVAVCRLYRRARTEDERQARRARKKKMSDVWVYHVHRPGVSPAPRDSPSQQILRKLRASHENLRATLAAAGQDQGQGTLGQEESQVLEELEVTTDLFLHDTSRASSRCSSLSDPEAATALRDLELETASALHDLDTASAVRELDKSSLYSVSLADFENDPEELLGAGAGGRKGRRKSRRRSGGSRDSGEPALPVAEFHNEAFDFAESTTAVERVQDVEL